MVMMDRKNKMKGLSEDEMEKSLKEIAEAKKNIAKYISDKRKELAKKGSLDDKGMRRLSSMEKAYNSLDATEHRISEKLDAKKSLRLNGEKNDIKKNSQELRESAKSSLGENRNIDRAASSAMTSLQNLSTKKKLTSLDKLNAKKALAALLMKQHAKQHGKESILNATKPKDYAKNIENLAESKSFKKAFPDKEITPEKLNKLLNDPKALERARQDLLQNMSADNKFINKNAGPKKQGQPNLDDPSIKNKQHKPGL